MLLLNKYIVYVRSKFICTDPPKGTDPLNKVPLNINIQMGGLKGVVDPLKGTDPLNKVPLNINIQMGVKGGRRPP